MNASGVGVVIVVLRLVVVADLQLEEIRADVLEDIIVEFFLFRVAFPFAPRLVMWAS